MKPTTCQCCSRKYETPEDYLKGTSRFRVCSKESLWFECSCGTGLILTKGNYEWYSPTLNMSEAAATVFKSVKEISKIPMIPTAVLQLQTVISSPNSNSLQIREALRQAPSLALEVIKAANCLKKAASPEIRELDHAISYIGRKPLSDLILTETLQHFDFQTAEFRKDVFWEESLLTGRIAEHLVQEFAPHLSKDEAYIAGSLCNIGKIVAAICFPESTDNLARLITNLRRPLTWIEAEDQLRTLSHVILGEVAAALWGFPEYVIHSIAGHHLEPQKVRHFTDDEVVFLEDDDEDPDAEPEVSIQQVVALANQFSHLAHYQPSRMQMNIFEKYADILKVSPERCQSLVEEFKNISHLIAIK
ncbi:MAG: HDOD domain-containing protein [Oligoflexus sp.]